MSNAVDALLVIVLLLNFFALGTSRLHAIINATALQGVLLGALAVLVHRTFSAQPILIAAGAALIKGFIIPWLLARAMRDVAIRREVEPFIGYIPSLFAGAVATALAILFARTLPLAEEHVGSLLIPASLATVLTGFIILTTRRKTITQVAGYLILENGIFIMGLTLVEAIPFLVEVGVLLDLLVGIFIMGIMIYQINLEFASLDTTELSRLKE
ncbi:hydrogenase [Pendulispora brunnea]|uniref:Hydrogenase n=1 Tax=Pendulispora brunnea TaxID=2905690 RepID=A0ABZ2JYV7_9BACT